MGRMSVFTAFLLFEILLLPVILSYAQEDNEPLTPAMFIFGDSLIDNGNNNFMLTSARANYYPYGIDVGGPTGRFCNGLTVVDYGARYLGLPIIPPYLSLTSKGKNVLRGVNYASAAAGILDETGRHFGQRTTLNGQIQQFATTATLQLPPLFENQDQLAEYLAKSIFLINIGGNDYINNYLMPAQYDSSKTYSGEAYADLLVNTFSDQLTRLYKLGARKIVLVGSGPLGCIPSLLSMAGRDTCIPEVNNLVSLFNSGVKRLSTTISSNLPGSSFVYQNIYDRFLDIINNPAEYGFNVANKACCGNGKNGGAVTCLPLQAPCATRNQYVFWDAFHPTQAANAIIAHKSYSPDATDCTPISIYELAKL